MPVSRPVVETDELAELVAWQLLDRWGIVFRDIYRKERLAVPWRDIQWALRRLEARGQVRGGHFVTGVPGEQFAHTDAWDALKRARRAAKPPVL
jgi:ATP-dependent Lhr-like helicase